MIDMSSDVRYSVLSEKSDSNWTSETSSVHHQGEMPSGAAATSSNSSAHNPFGGHIGSARTKSINHNSFKSITRKTSTKVANEFELANKPIINEIDFKNIELAIHDHDAAEEQGAAEKQLHLQQRALDDDLFPLSLHNVPNHTFKSTRGSGDSDVSAAAAGDVEAKNRTIRISSHSFTETLLLVLVIVLLIVIFLLFASLITMNRRMNKLIPAVPSSLFNTSLCTSDRCILVSSSIYKSLNRKVDPCSDFYEYSCGGFIKSTLIPAGFPRWGTLNLITYENQLLIKDQLESNLTQPYITDAEVKAKVFYESCIDSNGLIENLGPTPLKNILNAVVYKNATTNRLVVNETFENLLSMIQITYGLNSLFEFNVLDDDKNSSFSNIEIIQGSLGLERSYYLNSSSEKNSKALEIYKKTIVNVLNMLFDGVESATQEMEDIVALETQLASIMLPTEKLSNVEETYSLESMSDLDEIFLPYFNWRNFLNRFLKAYNSNETLSQSDTIIVMGLEYFHKLRGILDVYHSTPEKEKTLKLAVVFHLIKFSLPLLSKEYRNQFSAIGEALTGTIALERWQTCIEHTDNIFGLGYAVTKMFLRAVPNNSKYLAQELIKSIKQSFVDNFYKLSWMDEETSRLAEDKVNHVDDLIGYPDFIENDEILNLRYKELNVTLDDYFGNEIRLVQYALKSEILTYRTRVNKAEWEMTSSAVNAYYSPTRNQIVFPSGILKEPFFHPENPMSINYGSIGSIMGHELTHGFDDSGREYDKNGMMHPWWNNLTIQNFKTASECIIDQYSSFIVEGEKLNGRQTLGENIADNGGLSASYRAYEKWIEKNGDERPLPLLNLSHRQLFFVSFAQTWCSKSTPDSMHLSLSVDHHSPPRFRVIGSVANSEEFANAFNCPVNKDMNPKDKCKLW